MVIDSAGSTSLDVEVTRTDARCERAVSMSDPDACVAFYRDVLEFEVRNDVGSGTMR